MSGGGAKTYPVETIASLLLITPRRVQQLAKEGVIPRATPGEYELAPAVQGYVKYLQEKVSGGGEDTSKADVNKHNARRAKADADIAEMQAAKMAEQLVSAEDVSGVIVKLVSELRVKLLNNVPTRIAARAKSEKKATAIKAIAKEEITGALRVVSELDPASLVGAE